MPAPTRTFDRLLLRLVVGDLAGRDADAVVVPADAALEMLCPPARAVKAKGGEAIEAEAKALAPAGPGYLLRTSAGALPCRFVYHAVLAEPGEPTTAALVREAVDRLLGLARDDKLARLALPLLGYDHGLRARDAFDAMLAEIRDWAGATGARLQLELVLEDDDTAGELAERLAAG